MRALLRTGSLHFVPINLMAIELQVGVPGEKMFKRMSGWGLHVLPDKQAALTQPSAASSRGKEEIMKFAKLAFPAAMALFTLLAIPVQLAAQEQQPTPTDGRHFDRYTVIDLGTLGGVYAQAKGINNEGWVAGLSSLVGDATAPAFLWRRGRMTKLGTLGGIISQGNSINDRGEIVGLADTSATDPLGENFCGNNDGLTCLPTLWRGSVISVLPTLGGNNGTANGINNRGQVVGVAENTIHDPTCIPPNNVLQFKPVIWDEGQVRELPTFPGDPDGLVQGINDNGQAVGVSGDCNLSESIVHGLLWQHGKFTDLGNVDPTAINNRAQVTGDAFNPRHAFLWQDGVFTDLGTVPGDVESEAGAINDKGQVVGQSCDANGNCHAFLWENGAMTDLNALIPTSSPLYSYLFEASGINSRGEISGSWMPSPFVFRAFLAIPVPSDSK